jgi:hypothetical protein
LQRLEQILAESNATLTATRDGTADPADVHLASVPLERIRRTTSELQLGSGIDIDDVDAVTMRLLLNDYTTAVAHLRAVARLTEQHITAATAPIQETRLLVQRQQKLEEDAAKRRMLEGGPNESREMARKDKRAKLV